MHVLILLIVYNFYCFVLMRLDKFLAIKNKKRISERLLMLHAILMGGWGIWWGMYFPSAHKTHTFKFKWGIPLIVCSEIAASVYLFWKWQMP